MFDRIFREQLRVRERTFCRPGLSCLDPGRSTPGFRRTRLLAFTEPSVGRRGVFGEWYGIELHSLDHETFGPPDVRIFPCTWTKAMGYMTSWWVSYSNRSDLSSLPTTGTHKSFYEAGRFISASTRARPASPPRCLRVLQYTPPIRCAQKESLQTRVTSTR